MLSQQVLSRFVASDICARRGQNVAVLILCAPQVVMLAWQLLTVPACCQFLPPSLSLPLLQPLPFRGLRMKEQQYA
ncbi:unnamed protein product [Staurois parvus]|uniref:Uncharacterized protein n=1 Tax=Staurois parvus TaxID=386267 RepID=A0ABN9D8L6_9NEOB|nr:unnamed protein product [Staurois parvus]